MHVYYAHTEDPSDGGGAEGDRGPKHFPTGGYMACVIPLVQSANGNGNGIPFPFVSVKKIFESSVSIRFH